ncbi:MAG: putative transcriptional regulator [Eubacterium sp.]|nr:putative transcriptional regulator [Eubacterium sp.]
MPINRIILEKRKEIGLTQEQIAGYLGVSAPAVNKWERGVTYPDISLLPALARLLKIDLNTLLCFNEGLSEQEVGHFSNEVAAAIRQSGFEAGFAMGMEKVREYPNCDVLIDTTALLLDGALLMYGAGIDNKEHYENQITALYERAAKSDNDLVRNKAIYMLASKYMGRMEYEKAQEMLDLLPDRTELDKKQLQAKLFIEQDKLPEAAGLLERKLFRGITEVHMILMSLAEIELKEGSSQNASQLAELSQKVARMFDLGDMNAFVAPLQVALSQKNVQDSISLLKSFFSATLTPWDIRKSPLYRHMAVKVKAEKEVKEEKEEVIKEKQENLCKQVLQSLLFEIENSPKYEFLHSNAEFQQLVAQFRPKC